MENPQFVDHTAYRIHPENHQLRQANTIWASKNGTPKIPGAPPKSPIPPQLCMDLAEVFFELLPPPVAAKMTPTPNHL